MSFFKKISKFTTIIISENVNFIKNDFSDNYLKATTIRLINKNIFLLNVNKIVNTLI